MNATYAMLDRNLFAQLLHYMRLQQQTHDREEWKKFQAHIDRIQAERTELREAGR